ncbi:MAG: glutamine cyclotransferase [Cellvibrionaceae bacterium]|jgi:glutamine cyclotransferase
MNRLIDVFRAVNWAILLSLVLLSAPARSLTLQPSVILEETHDSSWFTQGLFVAQDGLYVSSGKYGRSALIKQFDNQIQTHSLPARYFAEGLTVIGNDIYLLTWREQTLLIFDRQSLELKGQRFYQGEGWGLTHSEQHLIMSNGSHALQFRNRHTFALEKTLITKVDRLNELEYVQGTIWANRWYDDHIYAIDVESGCVHARIDLSGLRIASVKPNRQNVVNGIAYDRENSGLWVTGKYWPKRYLIKLPQLVKTDC